MTWLHCHPDDGSVVSCSEDDRFNEANASDAMRKEFVNIYTDMTIEQAREFKGPSWIVEASEDNEGKGIMDHKHPYQIDLTNVVPLEDQDKIEDRTIAIPLVTTNLDLAELVLKPSRRG
jgi:hypothetical protein